APSSPRKAKPTIDLFYFLNPSWCPWCLGGEKYFLEYYSYRKARMGLNLEALMAGQRPKAIPTKAEKREDNSTEKGVMMVCHPTNKEIARVPAQPIRMPAT